jgi:hypothetical protein
LRADDNLAKNSGDLLRLVDESAALVLISPFSSKAASQRDLPSDTFGLTFTL